MLLDKKMLEQATMKTMNCKQLGGACELEFHAETFEAMAELSQQHGTEMFKAQDTAHLTAMQEMRQLMQDPADMQRWFDERRLEFDALPET